LLEVFPDSLYSRYERGGGGDVDYFLCLSTSSSRGDGGVEERAFLDFLGGREAGEFALVVCWLGGFFRHCCGCWRDVAGNLQ
jgi:hypothetical protein